VDHRHPDPPPPGGSRPRPWSAALAAAATLLALALGVTLRLWNLSGQILGGDELHAVRAALSQPLAAILTTYQLADSCIPLTALDRLLVDHGVALTEWVLRLPVLACGLAALVALPALAWRHLKPAARPLFCGLLAVSPLLVLYSRIARPYMPATLLSFTAVMAFDRWWRSTAEGSRNADSRAANGHRCASRAGGPDKAASTLVSCAGSVPGDDALTGNGSAPADGDPEGSGSPPLGHPAWAAVYVVTGALAAWFHLGAAPLVVAPLLFAAGDLALARLGEPRSRRGAAGRSWRHGRLAPLALAAAGLAAACALFLVPAGPSLLRLIAAKHQPQAVPAATWWGVLQLQAGTAQRWPGVIFWAAVAAGAAALVRRCPRLGLYLLVVALAQPAGILVLSPLGLARLQVLDRYLLPALPVVLLWVAAGLTTPWWPRQERLGRLGQRLAAAGLAAVWLLAGPFADAGFRASSFQHHNDLVAFTLPCAAAPPGGLPRPYRTLGGPPSAAVVELPWPPAWDFGRSFHVYQEIHGLRVLVAPAAGALPADARLRLRNAVAAEPAALLASGARYVVLHCHLAAEEERLILPAADPPLRRLPPAAGSQLAAFAAGLAARLTSAWGPPDLGDEDVLVWDLKRLRARRGPLRRSWARAAPP
jgi:hypothetical protein